MAGLPTLRGVLERDRLSISLAMFLLFAVTAAYTVLGIGMDLSALKMTGMAGMTDMPASHSPGHWTATHAILVLLMWWVMMVAMMLPSAAPTILLHASLTKRPTGAATVGVSLALLAGYLTVWGGFSIAAALVQWLAERAGLMSAAMMMLTTGLLGPAVLVAAGAWQLTTQKDACLQNCRSPAEFLTRHRPRGQAGNLRLGIWHGLYCVGCCWGLMALLFVGGVMNLYWIVGLAALVAVEKLTPVGRWVARIAGVGLIFAGLWYFTLNF